MELQIEIIAIVVIGAGLLLLWRIGNLEQRANKKKLAKLGAKKNYFFGKYLSGFDSSYAMEDILCAEVGDVFVFIKKGREIGRIQVQNIKQVLLQEGLEGQNQAKSGSSLITIRSEAGGTERNVMFEFVTSNVAKDSRYMMNKKVEHVLFKEGDHNNL